MVTKTKSAAPAPSINDVAQAISKAGIELFKERTGLPLNQAQRNLSGRTHYVDDSTLKGFGAKVHSVSIMDEGLVLGMLESLQKGFNAADGRVWRPVFFDVFGNVIYRPDIEESFDNQKEAMAEFWKQSNEIDAVQATLDGAKAKQQAMQNELEKFTELVDSLE